MTKEKAPFKMWVYHPVEAAKIVLSDEWAELKKAGWFDCPAKAAKAAPKTGKQTPAKAAE